MSKNEHFMRHALVLATKAAQKGEVPVGAVLVREGEIIGEGWNQPIGCCDPTAHAEIVALRAAATACANYRLPNTTLYVTIEPCAMCAGALIHARVARLVFGAHEPKAGAVVSNARLLDAPHINHRLAYAGGVLQAECAQVMAAFFQAKRRR
jgi:tRNA(adenine34) deaminase